MPHFTEKAIQAALMELLEEQPLDKITVRTIAEKCGISRNTFYYHYHDIYDLLEKMFAVEEERMLSDMRDVSTMRQGFMAASQFAIEHRKALYHIYNSMSRDMLTSYLYRSAAISMRRYIEGQCGKEPLAEQDMNDLVFIMASMIEGAIINIMREGLSRDVETFIENAIRIMDGTVHLAIQNCRAGEGLSLD